MKKFLKITAMIALIVLLIGNTYVNVRNRQATALLMRGQSLVLSFVEYYNEMNAERNNLLEEKLNKELKNVAPKEEKPSFEYIQSVTVRILNIIDKETNKGSVGTGTIVKITEDFTYILTNKHVAPKGSNLLYVIKNEKKYKAEVLKNGLIRDLSLIRIVGKIPDTNVVKGFSKTKEQNKVYSVGMYLGAYDIYTEGTVAGWKADSRLMNLPCLFGCSGSGVFDKDGNMVAVVFAGSVYSMFGGFDTAKAICVPYIGIVAFLEEIL